MTLAKERFLFSHISIDGFVKQHVRSNPGENAADLHESFKEVVKAKRDGAICFCGRPICAVGSAITGTDVCFTCTTGESDSSDGYEINEVCF